MLHHQKTIFNNSILTNKYAQAKWAKDNVLFLELIIAQDLLAKGKLNIKPEFIIQNKAPIVEIN